MRKTYLRKATLPCHWSSMNKTLSLLFLNILLIPFAWSNANINTDAFLDLDHSNTTTQYNTIITVKNVESYIQENGLEKVILHFKKNARDIFIADYNGMFFVSPLHPELIGSNQYYYKDSTGAYVVQEEINKAKSGGGWLKGRWRKDPETGTYLCRKIYILPIKGNFFIGSWYHYPSDKQGECLI